MSKNNISSSSLKKMQMSFISVFGIVKKKSMLLKKQQCYFTKSVTKKIYLCFDPGLALSEYLVNSVIKSPHSFLLRDLNLL